MGASAGGLTALRRLVAELPADFPAPICLVQHTPSDGPRLLDGLLTQAGKLRARFAEDGEPLTAGTIHIAPPGMHMVIDDGRLRHVRGPRENLARPAIDPLFRSAALHFKQQTIGVLLSGMLDDGVAGLSVIERCGGVAVIQDPEDAEAADMPQNALDAIGERLAAVLPADALGRYLRELRTVEPRTGANCPEHLGAEHRMFVAASGIDVVPMIGDPAALSCPTCGGPLWEMPDEDVRRYRCHVAHGFTTQCLGEEQRTGMEEALWAAVRTLDERVKTLGVMIQDAEKRGYRRIVDMYSDERKEAKRHADALRELFLGNLDKSPKGN